MESQSNLDELNNADANRVFWDKAATTFYDQIMASPKVTQMYQEVTSKVLARTKFDAESTVFMDFACGPGGFSTALAPHCKSIIGVDISQGMVDSYNARMKGVGITNVQAICAELQPDDPRLSGKQFDVVFCAQSYKHIEDNVSITRVLKSYLKLNGVLLVVDVIQGKQAAHLLADMKSFVDDTGKIPTRPRNLMSHMKGYSEDDMRDIFDAAGFIDFSFEEAFEKSEGGESFGLFLAGGVRPA